MAEDAIVTSDKKDTPEITPEQLDMLFSYALAQRYRTILSLRHGPPLAKSKISRDKLARWLKDPARCERQLRDASRYLKERIDKTLVYINNGDNLGQALYKTKLNFPDPEVINDLKIYSELDNFEEALNNMANEWLEESVIVIEQKASVLNMIALLAIGAVIAWAVMGTFEMQDQITSNMG